MRTKRTTSNIPTWPHDTEAMVGIALGLKEKERENIDQKIYKL